MKRIHFDTIDSTNTWAKNNAHQFPLESMTIVTADQQTAGRGQFNRKWLSPPKCNLYVSFCFFLKDYPKYLSNIPQVLAISVIKTLEPLGFHPMIKMPNDIMLFDKKLGGILCETTPVNEHLFVVVGLGLNINMSQEMLNQISQPAISLYAVGGLCYDVEDILMRITTEFESNLKTLLTNGISPFLNDFKTFLHR